MQSKRPVSRKSRFRLAIIASVIAHFVLLAALLYIPYRIFYPPAAGSPADAGKRASNKSYVARNVEKNTPPPAAVGPGRFESPEEAFDRNFEDRLSESIESARQRPEDEQRADLKASGETLAAISSEESIDEIAGKFKELNQTEDRAVTPAAEPVAGAFDYDTAQIHDVQRSGSAGAYKYNATLLDAKGRTLAIPLENAEGESLYETMQMVKQNPLMEKVYRQILMSTLDKMIEKQQ